MADTKTRILDVAEKLTQIRGFNGFSYIDLAEEIGVKTASIHYHYKLKADLALALVERIHEEHVGAFGQLDARFSSPEKRLTALVEQFESYLKEEKFCLCGMLSAEMQSVSPAVKKRLKAYFDDMRSWVAKQLKELGFKDHKNRSLNFVSALEGSLLIARLYDDPALIRDSIKLVKKAS